MFEERSKVCMPPKKTKQIFIFEQGNSLTAGAKQKKKKRCRFDDWQEKRRGTSSTESVEEHRTLDKWQTEVDLNYIF